MLTIRVNFKKQIDNPEYRYGDQNRSPWIVIQGSGTIVAFPTPYCAIVLADESGLFYAVALESLQELRPPIIVPKAPEGVELLR